MLEPGATKAELMRLSGVTGRTSFWRAYNTLEVLGLFQIRTDIVSIRDRSVPNRDQHVPKEDQVFQIGTTAVPEEDADVSDRDYEQEFIAADEMDADGDERQPKSNFQLRRKRQVQLIQEVWLSFFGEELNVLAAKELLQSAHSEAMDVYQAMLQAHERGVQYPRAYIRKIVEAVSREPGPRPRRFQGCARSESRPLPSGPWQRRHRLPSGAGGPHLMNLVDLSLPR